MNDLGCWRIYETWCKKCVIAGGSARYNHRPSCRVEGSSFRSNKVQESRQGSVSVSATETVTQGETRLDRFDGVHDPCECRVRIHGGCDLLLPC